MNNALEIILSKYKVDPKDTIISLPISRWKEFPLLLKEIGVQKMVEIGVYKGQFSEFLMKSIPDLDLTGVDAWKVYKGYKDYGPTDLEIAAYEEATDRAQKYGFKLKRMWSMEAVNDFEDESLDAVFIDGNHDFEHVVEDVAKWSRKVKKGGIVSGHDFFRNHHKRFGVKEAIPAWCEAEDIKPLFVVSIDRCPSWFYVRQ